MSPRVVLVGPMGAGKTTVADLLADAWGQTARDTDADIEAAEGRTVADIFVESGEPEFRRLEHDAVARALEGHDGVLALGGGAVLDPSVGLGSARPLLLGNVRGRIKTLLDERTPIYESVATLVVDTDGRSPEDVAREIQEALAARKERT